MNNCIYCTSKKISLKNKVVSPLNYKPYDLFECEDCHLHFFYPNIYEDIYTNKASADNSLNDYISELHKGRTTLFPSTKQLIKHVNNYKIDLKDKKILDIGAGDGINYFALEKEFAIDSDNYFANELDQNSIKACQSRGIKHFYPFFLSMESAAKINNKFDFIIFTHVLEHQSHPRDFMNAVAFLLNDGGYVFLTVPNRNMYNISRKAFPGDFPPHHFCRFNKTFFKNNFSGYEILKITDYPYPFQVGSYKRASKKVSRMIFGIDHLWFIIFPFFHLLYFSWTILLFFNGNGIVALFKK